ncbi:tRNA-splicing endonuclease subunit Sen2 [Motacilla alba alba]|uniref:tRNA-splicing endonuclease subunit Sen2 n=1 Tax=Motacilla alba alba TaxID=1094192 RepID=UPI0018D5776B|nr:tRNA-splicing endonuclease subunit Sen2 [Motacilla alba alba]XP_038004836.1 tRNA-splicing endonuclease subunit Sen2 [Motacilla alba alba]XP_038004838.1 tRNA-splicing endonuclease subunit Sen2 [Motacilla alba alba]
MAEAVFHPPRRKRRVFESYEAPFPVDVGGKDFRLCQAEIINNNVIVRNPEDIEQLYNKGYFGKGILSRSRPVFSISDPQLVAKWRGVNTNMPIITSQKYQRRVQWAQSVLQEQGLDSCSATRILESYTKPLGLPFCRGDGAGQAGHSCTRARPGNAEVCRKAAGREGAQSPEGQEGRSGEGGCAALDPGSASRDQEQGHPREMAEGSCHRDPPVLWGCEGKQSPEQRAWEGMDSRECAPEYVLVQEEEEGSSCPEDDSTNAQENRVKKEVLVCRKNPFRIFEYLQLSLEEAFFLVYALGCLSIYYGEEPLSIVKLWEVFSEVKPDFKTTYMAYHYFRGKGWVPKVGLKYGTDLLLYRKGPPFYHASYSVIAELVDDNFEGSLRRPLSWMSLSGLNRTTANASKELMLCYLIRPSDMTAEEMSTPECMKRIKVQELIVSRWVSSRERCEQDEF